jgi:DeoR family glycerol-3-phosphate regulon repressor
LLDFDPSEVAAREAMRANCRQSLLVVDDSKFGRAALARGGRIADIDHVFVDAWPAPPYRPLFEADPPVLHVAEAKG